MAARRHIRNFAEHERLARNGNLGDVFGRLHGDLSSWIERTGRLVPLRGIKRFKREKLLLLLTILLEGQLVTPIAPIRPVSSLFSFDLILGEKFSIALLFYD